MPNTQDTFKNRIVQHGIFNINRLYVALKDFYSEYRYEAVIKENTVKDKPQGYEVILKVNGERRLDDYCKLYIKTDFLIINVNKVEGENLESGNLRLFFESGIILDYRHNWERTKFGLWLRDKVYHKYLIKSKITSYYHLKAYLEGMALFDRIKKTLELY